MRCKKCGQELSKKFIDQARRRARCGDCGAIYRLRAKANKPSARLEQTKAIKAKLETRKKTRESLVPEVPEGVIVEEGPLDVAVIIPTYTSLYDHWYRDIRVLSQLFFGLVVCPVVSLAVLLLGGFTPETIIWSGAAIFLALIVVGRHLYTRQLRMRVTIDESQLTIEHWPFFLARPRRIRRDQVEQFYCSVEKEFFKVQHHRRGRYERPKAEDWLRAEFYALHMLTTNSDSQYVARTRTLEQALFLEEVIENYFGIKDFYIPGEAKRAARR